LIIWPVLALLPVVHSFFWLSRLKKRTTLPVGGVSKTALNAWDHVLQQLVDDGGAFGILDGLDLMIAASRIQCLL
jgi:hypothetical protein